jgi:hypothetical protein
MAAGLRKIAELAWSAFAADALPCHDHWAFIKPGIIIVGTEHNVYYAYLSELNSADPSQDTSTSTLSQSSATILVCPPSPDNSSVQGDLRVARLYGNLIEYAANEDAETGY